MQQLDSGSECGLDDPRFSVFVDDTEAVEPPSAWSWQYMSIGDISQALKRRDSVQP